jgi:Tol biopolymer transport system component
MMGVRAGLVSVLSGVVVAGLVTAPTVTGAGGGVGEQAPTLAAESARAAVQVPVSTWQRPTVRLRSTTKLVVNIDPNLSGSKSWAFVLKRRTATGAWERVGGVYRTRGAAEIRRLRVEPGTYRVRVRARRGYRAVTTRAYQHTPSVVTTRVSVRFDGGRITRGRSALSSISGDGRWIAYTSAARNVVTDDTNNTGDVFLFDRKTRQTRRVSVRSDGGQATGGRSASPAISANGRWIAYTSKATNLVDDDTNGTWDVFLFDRDTGTTRRVSVRSDGSQATGSSKGDPAISADGEWISYTSAADLVADDTNAESDVFLFDRDTGTTERVSVRSDGGQADGGSGGPAISADGRWITYTSAARNLVADDTNKRADVFLFDRDTGTTRRVSVHTDGGQVARKSSYDPAISADGRWITYTSAARNLVADDTNGRDDVFLFDRDTGTIRRVSVRTGGGQFRYCCGSRALGDSSDPAISADGRWVTYSVYVEATYTDPNKWGLITDVFLTRMW